MSLTNTAIRNAKPGEKSRKVFDGRGLYLEISPSGGKWWRLKYRFDGKDKLISLGTYPDVSLKDARERREAARRQIANQLDPSELRKLEKAARVESVSNSFEVVACEWFAKHEPNWSTGHADRVISRLKRDVFP
ncbi:MAG: Arm DNA-binding domain-containing protein, partial [Gammaproteobacteria bacterium]|nr:Arm DNA-binding domain-containing protein [Gammaproteobacteria bacterium]